MAAAKKEKLKQARLPGTDDPALKDLESKAEQYVEIRDERMELTKKESALQDDLLALMKKYKKTEYRRDGIEIRIVPIDEKVKVKITSDEES